ncbi:2-amino-4-hydroxy-6-hydroxymethyldihydropteridine diphosphokinase [Luteimonas sp. FCS-9]|uniref:2-amino-4-hydroxy-6- hydroxymethyldihydropteridine diphosphokinase n=1 Tax=Luteimonas sp. FCS-9 TaxID=1547516 RepID=UPI00063EA3EF|nr:2-amino-4-hydroxy-6-hydroxymethyldihydropteridine diphosphokinase [Luteimonas sp. FCS-9]KLJ00309.1 2-amino-4-hydroxy-6-hydroxymethyldihydropteridine pyrophosphokinase [Luteimonas sp. FCS-9]
MSAAPPGAGTARVRACVGLGANLGDAAGTLRVAARALAALPGVSAFALSRLYRTPAWGVADQPDFVNAAAAFETDLPPAALLEALLSIETAMGRRRAADGSDRWGPRTLDLDLLLYGDAVVALPGLIVPHPHLHARAFALVPLLDVAPDATIPGVGAAVEVLAGMDRGDIEAIP